MHAYNYYIILGTIVPLTLFTAVGPTQVLHKCLLSFDDDMCPLWLQLRPYLSIHTKPQAYRLIYSNRAVAKINYNKEHSCCTWSLNSLSKANRVHCITQRFKHINKSVNCPRISHHQTVSMNFQITQLENFKLMLTFLFLKHKIYPTNILHYRYIVFISYNPLTMYMWTPIKSHIQHN